MHRFNDKAIDLLSSGKTNTDQYAIPMTPHIFTSCFGFTGE
jgi:hypothetical protein